MSFAQNSNAQATKLVTFSDSCGGQNGSVNML